MLEKNKLLRYSIVYYGLLQSAHLITLLLAGLILLQTGEIPFPAPAPPGGWSSQAIPFLVGMGFVDVIAICLAFYFCFSGYRSKTFSTPYGNHFDDHRNNIGCTFWHWYASKWSLVSPPHRIWGDGCIVCSRASSIFPSAKLRKNNIIGRLGALLCLSFIHLSW